MDAHDTESSQDSEPQRRITVAASTDIPWTMRDIYPVQISLHETDRKRVSLTLTDAELIDLRDALDEYLASNRQDTTRTAPPGDDSAED